MSKAIISIIIVFALLAGVIFTLRRTARTGLPAKDLAQRATQHARELEARDKADE